MTMNAQEKVLEYAKKNNKSGLVSTISDQEFVVTMMREGVCIARTPNSKTIARMTKANGELIITETVKSENPNIVNGKVEFVKTETTTEVMRIKL